MNNRSHLVLSYLAVFLALLACTVGGLVTGNGDTVRGSGHVIEDNRAVSAFDTIHLSGFGDIILDQGEGSSLRVEAEDNLLPYLETVSSGRTLEIRTKSGVQLRTTRPVRYYITTPDLELVTISGSGDLQAEEMDVDQFKLSITGSGDVAIGRLEAEGLEVSISGSGDVKIDGGEVTNLEVTLSGSGKCDTGDLASSRADIVIGGSGTATVWTSEALTVRISGSGDVRYYGSPKFSFSGGGSGDVTSLGDR